MKPLRELHPAWIAAFLGIAVVLWVLSGLLGGSDEEIHHKVEHAPKSGPVKVQARVSHAVSITREAIVSGRTAPVRSVTVRAETAGRVLRVVAERGALVKNNAVLVRLAANDRNAQLRQAKAILEQRSLQYKAATSLQAKGYQTAVDLAQAKANMESAKAEVERISDDIGHTTIVAPFAGVLETRPVEEGDFVKVGDEVARIIDQSAFVVRGHVSEDIISYLEPNQPGSVTLVNNEVRQGSLRYIASEADEQTRTYPVELIVSNPDSRLISGASAQLRLPLEQVLAHEVEPAILSLNAEGEFGIKSVGENNKVQFYKADIVRNHNGKVWLAGLPPSLRVITVGQGFVSAGDDVEISASTEEKGSADPGASEPQT